MTHDATTSQAASTQSSYHHLLAMAASLETEIQMQVQEPPKVDSVGEASTMALPKHQSHQLDPIAGLPAPLEQAQPTSNRPYTIWQAITAVAQLFQPQAIANADVLAVLNKVSTLAANNVSKVSKYQRAVTDIREHIQHVVSSEKWMNWGMAVLGVVYGCVIGFAIAGPFGLTAALLVGAGTLLLSNQINIGGQPLGNWLVNKISGGKIHTGDTSAYGAFDNLVYETFLKMGVPKGKEGRAAIEGAAQIGLGITIGIATGYVISGATVTTTVEDETFANNASKLEAAEDKQDQNTPPVIDGKGTATQNQQVITNDNESNEVRALARRAEQQLEATEKDNPGGVSFNSPRPKLRGLVMGLNNGNQVAQADTQKGNAYAEVLEGMGVSKSAAEWIGFAVGELITVIESIGGMALGSSPGDSNQMFMSAIRYISYVQPAITLITSGANVLVDYNLYHITQKQKIQKKHLDDAEADVQLIQQGQKAILGEASSTTQMITKEMEAAAAMIKDAGAVVQNVFQA